MNTDVRRYTAFSTEPSGGNPAGVVLDASALSDTDMLAIAAEVGYSETAFVFPGDGDRRHGLRFFSPKAEVAFCGHATVATGVALGEREGLGRFVFDTPAGEVPVDVSESGGTPRATLTSVAPAVHPVSEHDLRIALRLLGWAVADLDPALPPAIGFAGNRHLILAAATRRRLADLDYDFDGLAEYMTRLDLTTVQLVWRESGDTFHVRDPFPVGGVVEDAATGAAAAAFGGYLRDRGEVGADAAVTLHQGHDMGRPSLITVDIPASEPGIRVTGTAVRID